jgi:hypothetical protein
MTRATLAVVLSIAAGSTPALAQDGPNTLGAYFDAEGQLACAHPVPNLVYDLYWILTNAEADTLFEFEFAWAYDPEITPEPLAISLTVPPLNLCEYDNIHNLHVCPGYGYPTSEVTILVHMRMLSFTPLPDLAYITVGPATPPDIPGHASIWYGGATEPVPLAFAGVDEVDDAGWSVPGVARLDVSCTTPVATQTWGAIKAIFR